MKKTKKINRQTIQAMFLDYVNNFLSVYRFAEHYQIEEDQAYRIIDIGRALQG